MAKGGDEDYGVLSLLMQLRYEPRGRISRFRRIVFFPRRTWIPRVWCLVRREQPLLPLEQHAKFERLVKLSFSQRRKMMLKLLKQDWPAEKLAAIFEQLEISPQIRAEKVSWNSLWN